MSLTFQNKHRYAFYTIAEHDMHFIPMQKWYDIILHCHSNRRGQTLMVSWLWRRVIYGINLRVLVAMVTELCTLFISAMVWNAYHALQWYEMHTSANFEKSKTHIFSVFLKSINSLFYILQTSLSLSERFGTEAGATGAGDASQEGRKVFFWASRQF